ncbi:hypothetical protein HN51_052537 [Arachis hypogaea]
MTYFSRDSYTPLRRLIFPLMLSPYFSIPKRTSPVFLSTITLYGFSLPPISLLASEAAESASSTALSIFQSFLKSSRSHLDWALIPHRQMLWRRAQAWWCDCRVRNCWTKRPGRRHHELRRW